MFWNKKEEKKKPVVVISEHETFDALSKKIKNFRADGGVYYSGVQSVVEALVNEIERIKLLLPPLAGDCTHLQSAPPSPPEVSDEPLPSP